MTKNSDRSQFKDKEGQYRNIFGTAYDGIIINDLETGRVVEANPAACKMHNYTRQKFIGLELSIIIHPNSQKAFSKYFFAFQSDGVFETMTKNMRRDGSTFFADWRGVPFIFQGKACLLSIVRDVSKRIEAEQSLQKREETHTYEQTKILEISQALASMLEFQPDLILDQLHEIIEYSHGCLFALENSTLVALAMQGTYQLEQTSSIRIHLDGPKTLIRLFNGHWPVIINNIWSDDTPAQFLRSLLEDGATVLLEGMNSWMWVPLKVRGEIIGSLGVAHEMQNYFTHHHADLAIGVANQVAITMVNAELYERAQALAALEERQRLARNLHDAINQSLFSAGLIAEVLPRLWERDQEEARRSIEDLLRLTRGAQAEMRNLLAELRPSTLTDSDLDDLLQLLGNAFMGRTNIPIVISITEEFKLPAEVQIAFYRICQEALFNVAKHAKASLVEIDLRKDGAVSELCIRDNGIGFEIKQKTSGHYGLDMMNEHANSVGAHLTVTSQPGHGSEIRLRWTPSPEEAL